MTSATSPQPAMSVAICGPIGSLEAYVQRVARFPLLTRSEEAELARRLREENDLDAARQLVLSHLRFVVRVAKSYSGYGLPIADLVQEGNLGLMKAVRRFDPKVGVRLMSFAVHWMRAEICDYILRHWRLVKIGTTKAQRKLFFNLRKAKQRLGWLKSAEVQALATRLGVSVTEVTSMEQRLGTRDVSFDPLPDVDEEGGSPAAYLADPHADPALTVEAEQWQRSIAERMARAMQDLDPRSRAIVQSRWGSEPKATLNQLAQRHGVSAERIRQIEAEAIAKLRRNVVAC